jgi:hypothetical protein
MVPAATVLAVTAVDARRAADSEGRNFTAETQRRN